MSSPVTYVVDSLIWSAVGFVIGWVSAHLKADVSDIRGAIVTDEQAAQQPQRRQRRRMHEHPDAVRWLGVFVAVLAVATAIAGVYLDRKQTHVVDCQTRFNSAFAQSITTRAALADHDREALNTFMLTAFRHRNDRAQTLAAFKAYIDEIEQSSSARAHTPLPELPRDQCR